MELLLNVIASIVSLVTFDRYNDFESVGLTTIVTFGCGRLVGFTQEVGGNYRCWTECTIPLDDLRLSSSQLANLLTAKAMGISAAVEIMAVAQDKSRDAEMHLHDFLAESIERE